MSSIHCYGAAFESLVINFLKMVFFLLMRGDVFVGSEINLIGGGEFSFVRSFVAVIDLQ